MTKVKVNCSIKYEAKMEAIRLGLAFSEALEFGLAFKAAEREDIGWPSNTRSAKVEQLAEKLQEAYARIEELEEAQKIGREKN